MTSFLKRHLKCARKYLTTLGSTLIVSSYKETDFSTPEEMRTAFPNLDNFKYRNKWYVLDVGGNNLGLLPTKL